MFILFQMTTKVTEPMWDYELPPPFRHLNGGNVGTCCADVGQNFGCFGLAAQPTRLQYLKPWDWYSGFDIVVWVLGSLCYCCCVLICSALVVGEVPGRGRSRPKHQFYVLSLGSWVFSKRFQDRISIRLWLVCNVFDLWLGTTSMIGAVRFKLLNRSRKKIS